MNMIPILDLSPEIEHLWPELSAAFERVMKSGRFILGPEVDAFEREVGSFLGAEYCIGVNSGTDALVIALRALDIGEGDEVITTPFSFFATAECISLVGAKPVFVDVNETSFNLDPDLVERAITDRTRAILPVHLFGRPAAMSALMAIAREHHLYLVEDCAQSFGARYPGGCIECAGNCSTDPVNDLAGRMTGTMGTFGAFSFFPSKNLGAFGDAGLITTNDASLAEKCRMLHKHGAKKKYVNEVLGYNSRLDSLHAALLRVKLPYVQENNRNRRRVAATYNALLEQTPGLVLPEDVDGHVFHQYTVRILDGKRDLVKQHLAQNGVSSMVYYPIPQDRLPVYRGQYNRFPVSDRLSQEVLSLPIWPQMDTSVIETVTTMLKDAIATS